jgi:plastocyanin
MRSRTTRHMLAALAAAGALWPATASAATRSVTVGNDFFAPKTVKVAKGDKVKWIWKSNGRKHNVASPAFGDSGNRRRGAYSVRFTLAGRFQYFCFLHEGMSGTVVVRR